MNAGDVSAMTNFSALDRDECLQLLKEKPIGRVLLVENGVPTAYPVNYILCGEEIIFATSSKHKIGAAAVRTTMGFEVDNIDPHTHGGWSVLGAGEPYVLTATMKLNDVIRTMGHSWAPGSMNTKVVIPLRLLHGRRLTPAGIFNDLCAYPL
jgi:nitroimidazol reductase NimA-like FMN-containing flavoprotein (pyridoxamine 5'-phosphate oxidase superfamily)